MRLSHVETPAHLPEPPASRASFSVVLNSRSDARTGHSAHACDHLVARSQMRRRPGRSIQLRAMGGSPEWPRSARDAAPSFRPFVRSRLHAPFPRRSDPPLVRGNCTSRRLLAPRLKLGRKAPEVVDPGGLSRRCRTPFTGPAESATSAAAARLLRNVGPSTRPMGIGPARYENCMTDAQVSPARGLPRM